MLDDSPSDPPQSGDEYSRYRRQMLFARHGREGQERLAAARVGLVGCGALGSVIATELVRAGVGYLKLIDRDFPDLSNLHRQILYDEEDVQRGMPKALIASERLRAANSDVEVEPVIGDLNPFTIDEFAAGLDVLADGTDNFSTRYLINDWAVKNDVPWVYGGVIGASGVTMTVAPRQGPCFRCLYPDPPAPDHTETCDTAGVLNMVVGVVASLEAAEVVKLLVEPAATNRRLLTLDVWEGYFEYMDVPRRDDCRACGRRDFPYLDTDRKVMVEHICGSNAYQIVHPDRRDLDLNRLADRLSSAGAVENHGLYLELEAAEVRITIFPDGRALVAGASDEGHAHALYDRFIGS